MIPAKTLRQIAKTIMNLEEVPENQRKALMDKTHLDGHVGGKKMATALTIQGKWWQTLRADLEEMCASCKDCLKYSMSQGAYVPPRNITAAMPYDHVCVDIFKFRMSQREMTRCLVVVDVLTRYVVYRAMKDKTAQSV